MTKNQAKSKLAELTVRELLKETTEVTTGEVIEQVQALFWAVGFVFTAYNRGEVLDWIRLVGPQCDCPNSKQGE